MAEIKNTFLKSKMNKDLDERLLPNGEYRDALNIAIAKSEDGNVGAAENVQGTELLFNGNVGELVSTAFGLAGEGNILVICGQYTDEINNNLYLFLTNNYDILGGDIIDPPNENYEELRNHAICRYDLNTGGIFIYSGGPFLNFSISRKIRNIDLLEDLLFWTDNRNQPRVLNINNPDATAINDFTTIANLAYTTEDQITVCRYSPYRAIDVWKNAVTPETTLLDASSPNLPAVTYAITGITGGAGDVIRLDNTVLPLSVGSYMNPAALFAAGYQIWSTDGQINKSDNAYVSGNPAPATTDIQIAYRNAALPAPVVRFQAGLTLYFGPPNPNFVNTAGVADYPGDAEYLKDIFARFSYRFKFNDGQFSLMAPFTQSCFIPEQYGFFLENDETETYESTVVKFMQNQVNKILLQIPMPDDIDGTQLNANELNAKLDIDEISILYKESDSLAVKVVETLTAADLIAAGAVTTYEYEYQSTEPFKTLPEAQTTRVFDKVPVKAHGQEIISNRIVYSNFQNKHTPPSALDYNVGVSSKIDNATISPSILGENSLYAYPNHTVKQNRTYQVGVVLSDRYGRTSTILLSNNQGFVTSGADTYGADTLNIPYISSGDDYDTINYNNLLDWPGYSLKVYFNSVIHAVANPISGTPGMYHGDPTSPKYNPLGWYTYKIVVKQKEQEYYNVYLPGITNGYSADSTQFPTGENELATVTLLSDNINKVPRDLSEVGPDQRQFRSSVRLWGRITPQIYTQPNISTPAFSGNTNDPTFNTQYYPAIPADSVVSISTLRELYSDLFQDTSLPLVPTFLDVYESESNPYQSVISTVNVIGALGNATGQDTFLSVYETDATESKLDIFWESSTSGLITDLNTAINAGTANVPFNIEDFQYDFEEDRDPTLAVAPYTTGQGPILTDDIYIEDSLNAPIDQTTMTMVVVNGDGTDVTSLFTLVRTPGITSGGAGLTPNGNAVPNWDTYTVQTTNYFVFLENVNIREFTFTLNATNTVTNVTIPGFTEQMNLGNVAPTISPPLTLISYPYNDLTVPLINRQFTAVNGTDDPVAGNNKLELIFSIELQQQYGSDVELFAIDANTGVITQLPGTTLSGPYTLNVAVLDANAGTGTLSDTYIWEIVFGKINVNCQFIDSGDMSGSFLIGSQSGGGWWSRENLLFPGSDTFGGAAPTNSGGGTFWNWPGGFPTPTNPVAINSGLAMPLCLTETRSIKSIDLSNGPSWCTTGPLGLTQGVAYITIRFVQELPDQSWLPAFLLGIEANTNFQLQTRNESVPGVPGAWGNMVDLNGNDVNTLSGGEWIVGYSANTALGKGVLEGTGPGTYPTLYTAKNFRTTLEQPASEDQANNDPITIDITRTFAFKSSPSHLGVRAIVDTITGIQTSWDSCSLSIADNSKIKVSIEYGDFWYPNGQTNIAWQYEISSIPQPDTAGAENYDFSGGAGVDQVFAREPIFRYVTQFYTDDTLTTLWTPSPSAFLWHAYKRRQGSGIAGVFPNPFGDDAAFTGSGTQQAPVNQNNRRWIAQFNATGFKINDPLIGSPSPVVN